LGDCNLYVYIYIFSFLFNHHSINLIINIAYNFIFKNNFLIDPKIEDLKLAIFTNNLREMEGPNFKYRCDGKSLDLLKVLSV